MPTSSRNVSHKSRLQISACLNWVVAGPKMPYRLQTELERYSDVYSALRYDCFLKTEESDTHNLIEVMKVKHQRLNLMAYREEIYYHFPVQLSKSKIRTAITKTNSNLSSLSIYNKIQLTLEFNYLYLEVLQQYPRPRIALYSKQQ